ncbi:hypothetical protein GLI01_33060 [Gluconacetobacter liquefaciens]|uniref:DUF4935 domain-containing protein n=1 Tax=Gluconacetobacter liquefaciens TaxID=89584 RepID=A0A370G908_GLULI|nr:PIN domain-containing protein [Gluconacetobacter liquefaciens]MBB2184817.1 DUF4935 domain-containing protein [Gluconacetobacter liquefaciens]RDI40241.1 hypothetical protein C7453_10128 [Gluconacetobacter liquefaciens]GEB39271.1 hypothetical protein GLI01_33060 [Gluconacetobacter liquefaciens]
MSDASKRGGPEPIVPLKDDDAFWLSDLYPDAKALFGHEQVSLDFASKESIVVLDANVLLLPFEFTSASVKEVERVYRELCSSKRLVVPGQAAREFYKNRSNKITVIADAIDASIVKAKKQIFDKTIPLLESDADYLKARALGAELVKLGQEIALKLEIVNKRLKDEIGGDRVSLLYRTLLGDCVSDFEVKPDDRQAISKEVARRARLKIAPGYKDQQKEDGGIGDYLVWKSILHEGEKRKAHCIFVTEEEKPDWWVKRHGTFQPRPELIDEYRRASDGKSIHLVPLSGLLSVFKANEEVVQQVQKLEQRKRVVVEIKKKKPLSSASNRISVEPNPGIGQYIRFRNEMKNIDNEIELVRNMERDGIISQMNAVKMINNLKIKKESITENLNNSEIFLKKIGSLRESQSTSDNDLL